MEQQIRPTITVGAVTHFGPQLWPWPIAVTVIDARDEIATRAEEAVSNVEYLIQRDRFENGSHFLPRCGGRFDVRKIALARIRSADKAGLTFEQAETRLNAKPKTCASVWDHELHVWCAPPDEAPKPLPPQPRAAVDPSITAERNELVELARERLGEKLTSALMSGESVRSLAGEHSSYKWLRVRLSKIRERLRTEATRCGMLIPHTVDTPVAPSVVKPKPISILSDLSRGLYAMEEVAEFTQLETRWNGEWEVTAEVIYVIRNLVRRVAQRSHSDQYGSIHPVEVAVEVKPCSADTWRKRVLALIRQRTREIERTRRLPPRYAL